MAELGNPFAVGDAAAIADPSRARHVNHLDPVPMEIGPILRRSLERLGDAAGFLLLTSVFASLPDFASIGIAHAWPDLSRALATWGGPTVFVNGWIVQVALSLVGLWLHLGIHKACIASARGHRPHVVDLWTSPAVLVSALFVHALSILAVTVGALALVVPAFLALASFQLATMVAIDERVGPWAAMVRSEQLTRGFRGTILGVVFAASVVISGVSGLLGVLAGYAVGAHAPARLGIVTEALVLLIGVVVPPLMAMPTAVMYHARSYAPPRVCSSGGAERPTAT